MNLILIEPGNTSLFSNENDTSIYPAQSILNPYTNKPVGFCIELGSVQHEIKPSLSTQTNIAEFICTKYVDKTSARLYDYCLQAQSLSNHDLPSYIYVLRNTGERLACIMTFSLYDAVISEIQFQSHPDDMPTEQFRLRCSKVSWL